jgi:four helix bundle protein
LWQGRNGEERNKQTSNIERRTSNAKAGAAKSGTSKRRTSNVKPDTQESTRFNLEDRLLEYAAMIVGAVERLPATRTGNHIAGQLLRSGTSPLSNHGEAESAESMSDFCHKLRICLKELRESKRWLRLIYKVMGPEHHAGITSLLGETDELIRIFVASIKTAERRTKETPN